MEGVLTPPNTYKKQINAPKKIYKNTFMDMGVLAYSWAPTAAYFVLLAGAGALWVASAGILNTAFGRTVLPMPGPILK